MQHKEEFKSSNWGSIENRILSFARAPNTVEIFLQDEFLALGFIFYEDNYEKLIASSAFTIGSSVADEADSLTVVFRCTEKEYRAKCHVLVVGPSATTLSVDNSELENFHYYPMKIVEGYPFADKEEVFTIVKDEKGTRVELAKVEIDPEEDVLKCLSVTDEVPTGAPIFNKEGSLVGIVTLPASPNSSGFIEGLYIAGMKIERPPFTRPVMLWMWDPAQKKAIAEEIAKYSTKWISIASSFGVRSERIKEIETLGKTEDERCQLLMADLVENSVSAPGLKETLRRLGLGVLADHAAFQPDRYQTWRY